MTTPLPLPSLPTCPICHKPVSIETSKTDENGHAVHEKCYVSQVVPKKHPKSATQCLGHHLC